MGVYACVDRCLVLHVHFTQALRLATPDFSQSPPITTAPDDAFYILKTVYTRLLSAGSLKILEYATDLLRDVMERDYAGGIKRKLDDVYRNAGGTPVRSDKTERECRTSFVVCPLFLGQRASLTCVMKDPAQRS